MVFDNITSGDKVGNGFNKTNNAIDKIVIGGVSDSGVLKLEYNDGSFLDIPLPVVSAGVSILTQSGSVDITGTSPNCQIEVPALEYSYNGDVQSIASTQFAFITPDPVNDRLDVVYLDPVTNTYGYIQGTPAISPQLPLLPAGTTNISTIYVYGAQPCENSRVIYSAIAEQMAQILIDLTVALEGVGVVTDSRLAPWDNTLQYLIGDACQVDGVFYKALSNNLGVDPTLTPATWEEITNGGAGFIYEAVAYVDTNAVDTPEIGNINKPYTTINGAINDFTGTNLKVVVLDEVCDFGAQINPLAKKVFIDAPHVDVATTGTVFSSASNFDITIRSKTRAHTGVLAFAVGGSFSFLTDIVEEVNGTTASMLTGGTYKTVCQRIFTSGNPLASADIVVKSDTHNFSGFVNGSNADGYLDIGVGNFLNGLWSANGVLTLKANSNGTGSVNTITGVSELYSDSIITCEHDMFFCSPIDSSLRGSYTVTGGANMFRFTNNLKAFGARFYTQQRRTVFFGGDNFEFRNCSFEVDLGGETSQKAGLTINNNCIVDNCTIKVNDTNASAVGVLSTGTGNEVSGTNVRMAVDTQEAFSSGITMGSGNSTNGVSNSGDPSKFLAQDGTYQTVSGGGASVSFLYKFNTNTSSGDPGGGEFRLNNTDPSLATEIYISSNNDNGADLTNFLTNLTDGKIYIQQGNDSSRYISATVTNSVDNTNWFTLTITVDDSGTLFENGSECGVIMAFITSGGSAQVFVFDFFKEGTVNNLVVLETATSFSGASGYYLGGTTQFEVYGCILNSASGASAVASTLKARLASGVVDSATQHTVLGDTTVTEVDILTTGAAFATRFNVSRISFFTPVAIPLGAVLFTDISQTEFWSLSDVSVRWFVRPV